MLVARCAFSVVALVVGGLAVSAAPVGTEAVLAQDGDGVPGPCAVEGEVLFWLVDNNRDGIPNQGDVFWCQAPPDCFYSPSLEPVNWNSMSGSEQLAWLNSRTVVCPGDAEAAQAAPTLENIAIRDRLIADQEALLNAYRCRFDIDTHVVPGGCTNGAPAQSGPA